MDGNGAHPPLSDTVPADADLTNTQLLETQPVCVGTLGPDFRNTHLQAPQLREAC